ncbi:MAG: prepilin peptidase [Gluconacetobacter diazotrophicus]|nr:prepilin peptidase [Gluconacetobacter diazotrophicus]
MLAIPGWLILIGAAPFVGSLGGVLYRRLPAGRPVVLARSECESCGAILSAAELVPVLSFLALRGRCRSCGTRIAPYHLAAELSAVAVAAAAAWWLGPAAPGWALAGGAVLGWTALLLAAIDLRHMRLPDVLTLPLLLGGLLVAVPAEGGPDGVGPHAAAAAIGYGAFRLLAFGYRRLRGRDGLGQGDAKLFAAAGAWLGPAPMPATLLLAALLTLLLAGAAILAAGRDRWRADLPIPFGPGLAAACWLFWMWNTAAAVAA